MSVVGRVMVVLGIVVIVAQLSVRPGRYVRQLDNCTKCSIRHRWRRGRGCVIHVCTVLVSQSYTSMTPYASNATPLTNNVLFYLLRMTKGGVEAPGCSGSGSKLFLEPARFGYGNRFSAESRRPHADRVGGAQVNCGVEAGQAICVGGIQGSWLRDCVTPLITISFPR